MEVCASIQRQSRGNVWGGGGGGGGVGGLSGKGSRGNFVLSTALLALSVSVVHCMVIVQSSHMIIQGVCP